MSGRKLAILALILVVLGLMAYLSRETPATKATVESTSGTELFENLDVNRVERIEIQADGQTNIIARKDGTWLVGNLFDYPADRAKIVEQLRGLKFLKIGQPILGGEKILEEVGLGNDKRVVRFLDGEGSELATLNIGKARTPSKNDQPPGPGNFGGGIPDGRYVSTGGDKVILIGDSLSTWAGAADSWVKKQILSVTGTDISTITVSSNDVSYTLNFEGNETRLSDLAEDEELDAPGVQRALSYLSFTSVADPALSDEETGMNSAVTYQAKTTDGIIHRVLIGGAPKNEENSRYARVGVSFEAPAPPTREDAEALVPSEQEPEPAVDGEGTAEEPENPAKSRDELIQEKLDELTAAHQRKSDETRGKVDELAQLKGWTFVLSKYSAESIAMGRDQLVEKIEEEEADENASEGPAAVPTPPIPPDNISQ